MVREPERGWGRANPWVSALARMMIADDLETAQRRMRRAWLAGFIFSGIFFFNAVTSFFGFDAEGRPLWTVGQFTFVMAQSLLTAGLSYGVKRRSRLAAVLLVFSFVIITLVTLIIELGPRPVLLAYLVIFGFLFAQGMRGALTYHYLTHPDYPSVPPLPETAPPETELFVRNEGKSEE